MTVQAMPERALSLYDAEHELLALWDSEGETASSEEEAERQAQLAETLTYSVEKREKFALFLLWLDQQQDIAKREIERLRMRSQRMENLSTQLRRYAINTILSLGTDHGGKWRKLFGHTTTMFLRALPVSVEIRDEAAVPHEFKKITIQLPATVWVNAVADAPVLVGYDIKAVDIDKEAVRRALQAGREVPGADLRMKGHDHTLVVK